MQSDSDYLNNRLNPIMETFVQHALHDQPTDIDSYMLDYFKNLSLSDAEKSELQRLRQIVSQGKASDEEMSTDENEEDSDELPEIVAPVRPIRHRTSVSAEAFGS